MAYAAYSPLDIDGLDRAADTEELMAGHRRAAEAEAAASRHADGAAIDDGSEPDDDLADEVARFGLVPGRWATGGGGGGGGSDRITFGPDAELGDGDADVDDREMIVDSPMMQYPAYSPIDENLLTGGYNPRRPDDRRGLQCRLSSRAVILLTLLGLMAITLGLSGALDSDQEPKTAAQRRLKVFVLAGQSNMAGFGAVDNTDSAGAFKNGTLRQLLADSTTKPHIAQVWDEGRGDFAVRDDVWIWMDRSDQDLTAENASWGPLTVGYGERDQHRHIGPELGFGMYVGDRIGEQVLIIKTAWHAKNLLLDFRPPSSGMVGPSYTEMIADVRHVLQRDQLTTLFPAYHDMAGYDIEGFVWYQGWSDGRANQSKSVYEHNLANLIGDVRSDLGARGLPVSVVLSSCYGWDFPRRSPGHFQIMRAQEAVADPALHPGIQPVSAVETRGFWQPMEMSPVPSEPFHYGNNAMSYWQIGTAAGQNMMRQLGVPKARS